MVQVIIKIHYEKLNSKKAAKEFFIISSHRRGIIFSNLCLRVFSSLSEFLLLIFPKKSKNVLILIFFMRLCGNFQLLLFLSFFRFSLSCLRHTSNYYVWLAKKLKTFCMCSSHSFYIAATSVELQ